MESIFEKIWRLGPAAFVLKAIIVAVISGWLLVFRGATLGSHRLTGKHRQWFNVIVALAFPALLIEVEAIAIMRG